jgi:hypothetical protein
MILCKIEFQCLARPHKISAKTIGEMSVHILGYPNTIILWMIVFTHTYLFTI